MRQERPEEERDGQEPGAGWGGVGTGEDRSTEESQDAGNGNVESGTKSKPDRWIKAKKNRWLREVGEPGEWLGVERSAKVRPARSLRGRKGRTENGAGKPRPAARSGGSRALTALLPQEHQLEFPQRIPEVSARGHDGAAAAASVQRPPVPTLFQPVDQKGEGKGRLSRPL